MENDTIERANRAWENAAAPDAPGGAVEIPEEVAQAVHRLLMPLWLGGDDPQNSAGCVEARDALWHWFRTGRLRVCRSGDADVLGVVGKYKLLRVPAGSGVRFAIEGSGGKRYYQDEEDIEEMACILNWHYLLFEKPDDPDAAGGPLLPETVRAFAGE